MAARAPRSAPRREFIFYLCCCAAAGVDLRGKVDAAGGRDAVEPWRGSRRVRDLGVSQSDRQKWLTPLAQMESQPDDVTAQTAGCEKLTDVIEPGVETQDGIIMDRGDEQAIQAMTKFPQDMALQLHCMDLLASLAELNCGSVSVLGQHGAVEAMSQAIRGFPDNKEMLVRVSNLNLLTDPKCPEAQENLMKVSASSVMDDVLNSVDLFSTDADVMASSLQFVGNSCSEPGMADRMSERGAPERLSQLLGDFQANERMYPLRGRIISVALKCFLKDPRTHYRLADAGFIGNTAVTMKAAIKKEKTDFTSNKNTFLNGMKAISLLASSNSTLRDQAVHYGVLEDIVSVMRADSLAPPGPACSALRAIAQGNVPSSIDYVIKLQCDSVDVGDDTDAGDDTESITYR